MSEHPSIEAGTPESVALANEALALERRIYKAMHEAGIEDGMSTSLALFAMALRSLRGGCSAEVLCAVVTGFLPSSTAGTLAFRQDDDGGLSIIHVRNRACGVDS